MKKMIDTDWKIWITISRIKNRNYNFWNRDDKRKVYQFPTKTVRIQKLLERKKMTKVKQNVSILTHVSK